MSHHKRKNPDNASITRPLKQTKSEQNQIKNPTTQYSLPLATLGSEPSPAFGQPHQLTCFSYTSEREVRFDTSALKYYVPAPLNADLGYRYEHWTKRSEERGRIDSLLRAVEQDQVLIERKKGAFVSWRGVMTKLMIAPLETRDPIDVNLMLLDGCIFAEEHATEAKLAEKENMTPFHRRMTYYGYSFESFSTWGEPLRSREQHTERNRARCWSGDVDTNIQFCSVVKTKIGGERMILGGEVDCCRDEYTGQPNTYVELKTSMVIHSAQDEQRFERKLLKFWAQSFLLGIPQEIVVGFRTKQGRISTLQTLETLSIPRLIRGKPGAWDPKPCLVFAENLLQFIRSTIEADKQHHKENTDDSPVTLATSSEGASTPQGNQGHSEHTKEYRAVWRLEIRPNAENVVLYKLGPDEVEEVRNGEDRVGFLPAWFWESAARE
ncbi:Protein RAI1 [Ceratobasidium theobromae]|uniref:Decapping nuclease n=1 Tax=Ceratobasidium theobromae TaxID=1582974 RepID=A0A5N5QQD4_9AGAM|nr:Protein RAI1 [Ceratobasidium theobromae]